MNMIQAILFDERYSKYVMGILT